MPLYPPPGYSSTPYAGAYPYYPPPPPPPKAASGSGFPPWVWVALGVVLAGLGGKLLEGAKSKQADLQQAMMQQMLKSMMALAAQEVVLYPLSLALRRAPTRRVRKLVQLPRALRWTQRRQL
jgi:hypothetical protein